MSRLILPTTFKTDYAHNSLRNLIKDAEFHKWGEKRTMLRSRSRG